MSNPMDMDSLNIYLKKQGEKTYIGLHAVGEAGREWDVKEIDGTVTKKSGFLAWETWGNEYVEGKMYGRGSFRVFGDIEDEAKAFEADGWVRFTPENV